MPTPFGRRAGREERRKAHLRQGRADHGEDEIGHEEDAQHDEEARARGKARGLEGEGKERGQGGERRGEEEEGRRWHDVSESAGKECSISNDLETI